jgi:hypothetical protein
VTQVLAAMRDAAAARRRDPARLAQAAADLAADSAAERMAAAARLAAARQDALPALVDVLQSDDPRQARARDLARGLVRDLGADARQPLLAWLGTGDLAHWRGIIEALGASGADDIDTFLLAPALVADTPAPIRAAAERLLGDRSRARVPRRDREVVDAGVLSQSEQQGVFAGTGSDHKDAHGDHPNRLIR